MNFSKLKKLISSNNLGDEIFVFDKVSSTNEVLDSLYEEGRIKHGAVVISDSQTSGRGRSERIWISPSGVNLYISLLIIPDIESANIPIFTFLSSCALKDTFSEFGMDSDIKWPNDILVSGKKISGVLTELKHSSKFNKNYLIIGIGVNINITKEFINKEMNEISNKVTSMKIELGSDIDREKFTAKLINNLDHYYEEFRQHGTIKILDSWLSKWNMVGQFIRVSVDDRLYKGVVEKVDENGFLYLRTDNNKIERIISGDMIF